LTREAISIGKIVVLRKQLITYNLEFLYFTGKTDTSSTEDILNIGGSTEDQEHVPLDWLQDWVSRNNNTANRPPASSGDMSRNEREELQVAFQSLFQVPNVKDRALPPCPAHLRRNHHGKCVRPVRIRVTVIEDSPDS